MNRYICLSSDCCHIATVDIRLLYFPPKLNKRGSITTPSDKSDDKKEVSKPTKDTTKTLKTEKSATTLIQDKDSKQSKTKKMSKDQSSEKKSDPTSPNKTPGGRRLSKADVRGTVSNRRLQLLPNLTLPKPYLTLAYLSLP